MPKTTSSKTSTLENTANGSHAAVAHLNGRPESGKLAGGKVAAARVANDSNDEESEQQSDAMDEDEESDAYSKMTETEHSSDPDSDTPSCGADNGLAVECRRFRA